MQGGILVRGVVLVFAATFAAGCSAQEPAGGDVGSPEDAIAPSGSDRDGSPSWSPDGGKIAFYSERDGNAEIYVMDADGANVVRLTDSPSDEGYPAFSPDGRRISFDSDRDGAFEIYTMNVDGTDVRRLTYSSANDVSAAWSPDGAEIAWMSNRSGQFEVWLMNADGSDQRQFTGSVAPSEGTHWFPQWSPDGNRLAFHVNRDVYTVGLDGSEYTRLTIDPDNGMVPSWVPGLDRIVFMSWRTGATEIHIMRTESIDPRVSPDGRRIVYTWVPAGGAGPKHLMLMNLDGSEATQLTGAPPGG
jgi:Tol biopolymer transport system component